MDMAILSSKGQVTIPVDIRRKLELREGDKVVFKEYGNNILIFNSNSIECNEQEAELQLAYKEIMSKYRPAYVELAK